MGATTFALKGLDVSNYFWTYFMQHGWIIINYKYFTEVTKFKPFFKNFISFFILEM